MLTGFAVTYFSINLTRKPSTGSDTYNTTTSAKTKFIPPIERSNNSQPDLFEFNAVRESMPPGLKRFKASMQLAKQLNPSISRPEWHEDRDLTIALIWTRSEDDETDCGSSFRLTCLLKSILEYGHPEQDTLAHRLFKEAAEHDINDLVEILSNWAFSEPYSQFLTSCLSSNDKLIERGARRIILSNPARFSEVIVQNTDLLSQESNDTRSLLLQAYSVGADLKIFFPLIANSSTKDPEIRRLVSKWAETSDLESLKTISSSIEFVESEWRQIIEQAVVTTAPGALHWLEQQSTSDNVNIRILSGAIDTLFSNNTQPQQVADLIFDLPEQAQVQGFNRFIGKMAEIAPKTSLKILIDNPHIASARAIANFSKAVILNNPDMLATMLDDVPDSLNFHFSQMAAQEFVRAGHSDKGLALAKSTLSDLEDDSSEKETFVDGLTSTFILEHSATDQLWDWISELPDENLREVGARSLAKQVLGAAPKWGSEWLLNLPPSIERDRLAAQLSERLSDSNIISAILESIEDPTLREHTVTQLNKRPTLGL